jgi:hypothetical protein
MEGPPRLFFFYQPRTSKDNELFASSAGDMDKIVGKCVYFIRDSKKPIKMSTSQDATVLFGEISAEILQSFEGTLANIFQPALSQQQEWGQIREAKDREQFLSQVHKFDDDLKRKIQNLRGDVTLKTVEAPFNEIELLPSAFFEPALDQRCVQHFTSLVRDWCKEIKKYITNDTSAKLLEDSDNAEPELEINNWSRRMLSLISITEQVFAFFKCVQNLSSYEPL